MSRGAERKVKWYLVRTLMKLPEKCEFDLSEVNNKAEWDIIC